MVTVQKAAEASLSCLPWPVMAEPYPHSRMPTGIEEFDRFVGGLPNHSVMAILASQKNKIWALELSQKIVETNADRLFGNGEERGMHLASFQEPLALDEILSLKNLAIENNCCAIFTHLLDSKLFHPGLNVGDPYEIFAGAEGNAYKVFTKLISSVDLLVCVDEYREPWTVSEHKNHRDGVPDPNGKELRLNLIKSFEGEVRHFFVKKTNL